MNFLIEISRVLAGFACGTLAIYFGAITIRVWLNGKDAYEANRKITPNSLKSTIAGHRTEVEDFEKRASHGFAINLTTRTIVPQQRLSREAVDDVIGRHV